MNKYIPWYLKIILKLILSRLPIKYDFWRKMSLFQHGYMHKPNYAYEVFSSHFKRSDFTNKENGFTAMEIGPGDSLLSAMVAQAYGARNYFLVDAGSFASSDLGIYKEMRRFLDSKGFPSPKKVEFNSIKELLEIYNSDYLTNGSESLKSIPDGSVDFVWSQAVLEHIRRDNFLEFMKEIRRVLKSQGVCSHRVDLKDHLGGGLNNMRISSDIWEQDWFANSGFYTNRIRFSEMLSLFNEAGFNVEVYDKKLFTTIPLKVNQLSKEFRNLSVLDLSVKEFDVLLTPKKMEA